MPLHINQMEIIMDSKTFEDIVTAIATMRAKAMVEAGSVPVMDVGILIAAGELKDIAAELEEAEDLEWTTSNTGGVMAPFEEISR